MKDFGTANYKEDPLYESILKKNSSIEGKNRYRISSKLKNSANIAEYLRDATSNTELHCILSGRRYLKIIWISDGELCVAGFHISGISYLSDNMLEYIVEKTRELSILRIEDTDSKGWDWAQKWLLEGKAIIRRCYFNPDSEPTGYLNSRPDSIHAIWWDPSDNVLMSSRPYSHYERKDFCDDMFELATLYEEDFKANDWMIYPHHASESDAWIDGDLSTEVELGSRLDPYWKNIEDIDLSCIHV